VLLWGITRTSDLLVLFSGWGEESRPLPQDIDHLFDLKALDRRLIAASRLEHKGTEKIAGESRPHCSAQRAAFVSYAGYTPWSRFAL